MRAITKPQIKKIRTMASHIFGDDEDYHNWLIENFGKKSTKKLNIHEASEAFRLLDGDTSGYDGRLLSKAQGERIALLQDMMDWDSEHLVGFVDRQVKGGKKISQLYKHEARKVIIGLQRVISKGSKDVYDWINRMNNKQLGDFQIKKAVTAIYTDNINEM